MSVDLVWDGCVNVRDLGGFATEDGARTRSGAVVRADNIRDLTDAGWQALVGHGVHRVVDLRFDQERAEDPPADVPVEVVHVSVFGHWDEEFERKVRKRQRATSSWEDTLHWLYLDALERNPGEWGRAVSAVATAPEGAVCIHCYAGKDRTGILAALLLRLAGVSIQDVAMDYEASGPNVGKRLAFWIDEAADDDERALRRRHTQTPAEAMRRVLEDVEARHGSVEGYLLAAGVATAEVDAARRRLREPA